MVVTEDMLPTEGMLLKMLIINKKKRNRGLVGVNLLPKMNLLAKHHYRSLREITPRIIV